MPDLSPPSVLADHTSGSSADQAGNRPSARLNLGIVAHVDAGKTSLTERLLYETGVIEHTGRVDAGDTQTDTDDIERQRGITIRSAVVGFTLGDLEVNLIDTPGHADFIAEVERALRVLDGAVLVVSAVEGVQAQTRLLMRALRRMQIPTLLFVNKVDRALARPDEVADDIRHALTPYAIRMSDVTGAGTVDAVSTARPFTDARFVDELVDLVIDDDETLTRWLERPASVGVDERRQVFAARVRAGTAHPVYAGSAITGAGVPELMAAITAWLRPPVLPGGSATSAESLRGTVFTIVRERSGEKIAYVRMRTGSLQVRQHVELFGRTAAGVASAAEVVTSVAVLTRGTGTERRAAVAGDIALVGGLRSARIGDQLGTPDGLGELEHLSLPGLETVVTPASEPDRTRVHDALAVIAEQDPLIDLRVGADGELAVSLYGEVQKEVLRERLGRDHHVEAEFSRSRTVYIERITGVGEARAEFGSSGFAAGVGLRVGPADPGSGIVYRLEVDLGSLLLSYHTAIEETVREALRYGLAGWRVPDAEVTLTMTDYDSVGSTAGDFRRQTPLALFAALAKAGTVVCEPMSAFDLTAPASSISVLMRTLIDLDGTPGEPELDTSTLHLVGEVPTERVHELGQLLPGLTSGEGLLSTRPGGYRPMRNGRPTRPRTDGNPLDPQEYLRHLRQRG